MTIRPTNIPAQAVQPDADDLHVTISGSDAWTIALLPEETLNDSDKSFTVTADQVWQILSIRVELTTTATVGDRQIEIRFQDALPDIIFSIKAGVVQAASLAYNYNFAPSMADLLAVRDTDWLMVPMPPTMIFPAGYVIRIYDNAGIDSAADDMIIQIAYAWRPL